MRPASTGASRSRSPVSSPFTGDVPIVITEGNYLLSDAPGWNGIRSFLDETWYLETDSQRRRERLVARHMRFGKTMEAAHAIVNGSDEHNAEEIGLVPARGRPRHPPGLKPQHTSEIGSKW